MNFIKIPLRQQSAGAVVTVTLQGVESDVFLVDRQNLVAFESGRDFRYVGGHYNQSPVQLAVPSPGDWTAILVPIGGTVRASASVLAA
jgi:hypothetical protein